MGRPKGWLSSNRLRYSIEALLLCGLAVAVFVPGGCSQSPISPADTPTHNTFVLPNGLVAHPGMTVPGSQVAGDFSTIPIRFQDSTVTEEGIWKDSVGTTGGVITMDVHGEQSYFSVQANSLDDKTEIRVTVYRDESAVDKRITEFHFEPEGLSFRYTSQLSYKTLLKEGEKLDLHYWDPLSGKWLHSAEAVVVNGYATFPIEHFSDYRTTERVSLGGQRGSQ